MNQGIIFLEVIVKYAVVFNVNVNFSVYNHFQQSCVIIAWCSGHWDFEALGVFNRRSYISALFELCPDILCDSLDCSYIFISLPAVAAVKDIAF